METINDRESTTEDNNDHNIDFNLNILDAIGVERSDLDKVRELIGMTDRQQSTLNTNIEDYSTSSIKKLKADNGNYMKNCTELYTKGIAPGQENQSLLTLSNPD